MTSPKVQTVDEALQAFSSVCENIRKAMDEIVQMKSKTKPSTPESITEQRMQGSFHFLSLKQLNRVAQIQCKQVKDKTLEAKQKLDGHSLQLENLQYEISHLHKEITKCLEFRSRHDDITLVPVNNFYKDAPPKISRPESTKSDEHAQTLARLEWELEQRKGLAKNLENQKSVKEGVLEKIDNKKQHLQSLAPSLHALLKSSLPIQDAFDLPIEKLKKQHALATLLPRPLFVLFLQAKAYQEACDDKMIVEIVGDEAAASRHLQMQIVAERIASSSEGASHLQIDAEESGSDQEEKDEEDSGRGHKSKKGAKKMDTDVTSSNLFLLDPLQVTIKLNEKKSGPSLKLEFSFVNKHKFSVVKCSLTNNRKESAISESILKNDNLLCCLNQEDFGLVCPNAKTYFLLDKVATSEIEAAYQSIGRPYLWVQQLCGQEFLSLASERKPGEDMQISFSHMKGTIAQLRKRIHSRMKLTKQLEKLAKVSLQCDKTIMALLPKQIHTTLLAWEAISYSDYIALPQSQPVVKLGILADELKSNKHNYFQASFHRGTTVSVKTSIVVFANHPVEAPLMMILLDWKGEKKTSDTDLNIREMEAELNVHWPKTLSDKLDELLPAQLMRLACMVDIYLETECRKGDSDQPGEFPLNRICPQLTKGPARLKPFLYRSDTKTHYHR